jgi:hypothetical protein
MLADRVLHTTTTTGTGTYDLIDPASALYLSAVSSVGTGNRLTYAVEFGSSWELCWGVVTAGSPATLTRNLIRSSTGALINWGAGTKTLYSISQADIARFGGRGSLPTSGGTANAQTLAHVTPLRSVQAGMEIVFLPGSTNTGATTLAVDALGAIAVLAPGGAACTGGELRAGVPARAVWNGTSWRLVSYSPSATGAALLAAADAAAARTAIGATTTGSALIIAADATAARTAIGATTTGSALIVAADATAARTAIGATTTGSALIVAADAAAARTAIGAQQALGFSPVNKAGDTMSGRLFLTSPDNVSTGYAMVNSDSTFSDWSWSNPNIALNISGTPRGIATFASDERQKQDIAPAQQPALPKLRQIQFIDFRFRSVGDQPAGPLQRGGVSAQQIQTINPQWVTSLSDDQGTLIPNVQLLLTNALQAITELDREVQALRARIEALPA